MQPQCVTSNALGRFGIESSSCSTTRGRCLLSNSRGRGRGAHARTVEFEVLRQGDPVRVLRVGREGTHAVVQHLRRVRAPTCEQAGTGDAACGRLHPGVVKDHRLTGQLVQGRNEDFWLAEGGAGGAQVVDSEHEHVVRALWGWLDRRRWRRRWRRAVGAGAPRRERRILLSKERVGHEEAGSAAVLGQAAEREAHAFGVMLAQHAAFSDRAVVDLVKVARAEVHALVQRQAALLGRCAVDCCHSSHQ
eukprot:COSAG05_NODE_1556_length_4568_cov_2.886776_6_plen_248_part_00